MSQPAEVDARDLEPDARLDEPRDLAQAAAEIVLRILRIVRGLVVVRLQRAHAFEELRAFRVPASPSSGDIRAVKLGQNAATASSGLPVGVLIAMSSSDCITLTAGAPRSDSGSAVPMAMAESGPSLPVGAGTEKSSEPAAAGGKPVRGVAVLHLILALKVRAGVVVRSPQPARCRAGLRRTAPAAAAAPDAGRSDHRAAWRAICRRSRSPGP